MAKRSKWEDDPNREYLDDDYSYYEEEVSPRLEKKRADQIKKCEHNQFFIYCSTCKHVLGSELSDPYEVLKKHKEYHDKLAGSGTNDTNFNSNTSTL